MTYQPLLEALFPAGHAVLAEGSILAGTARTAAGEVAVLGTHGGAAVGVEAAHRLAGLLLSVLRAHPGRPIVVLVDTSGQRMSRRDELLGLARHLGHLAAPARPRAAACCRSASWPTRSTPSTGRTPG